MTDKQSDKWKEKYLRSLDKLEQKEQDWKTEEALWRRAVGRLVHTGYGVAPQLDRKLDLVRKSIKAQEAAATLEESARVASETAIAVQEALQQPREAVDSELTRILESLIPDRSGKKLAAGQLASLKKSDTPTEFISRMPALLQLIDSEKATAEARGPTEIPESEVPIPPSEPGFLGRIFSPREKPQATPRQEPSKQYEWIFTQLLMHLSENEKLDRQLNIIRDEASTCCDRQQAERLLEQTSELLVSLHREERPSSSAASSSTVSVTEAMRELLQRIEIPNSHCNQVNQIKQLLSSTKSQAQIDQIIIRISELLEAIRNDVRQEKRELERFLEGVANRIQGMTESLLDLESLHQSADQSLSTLHHGFQSRIQDIRGNLRSGEDMQSLKLALEQSLDAMEEYMEGHVVEEERISRDAAQKIEDLSSRLHDMKHEAFLLQQQMTDERRQAQLDPLTGIYNRMALDERINSEIQRSKRYQEPLSLLVVDIDFFKRINDNFGHLAGDKVLKALAKRLVKNVRDVDMVARYGGEEFVVLLPNTGLDAAHLVSEKVRAIVEKAGFHHNQQPVSVTISGGVAQFRQQDNAESLFKRADDALYAAKKGGRNRILTEKQGSDTDHG